MYCCPGDREEGPNDDVSGQSSERDEPVDRRRDRALNDPVDLTVESVGLREIAGHGSRSEVLEIGGLRA